MNCTIHTTMTWPNNPASDQQESLQHFARQGTYRIPTGSRHKDPRISRCEDDQCIHLTVATIMHGEGGTWLSEALPTTRIVRKQAG